MAHILELSDWEFKTLINILKLILMNLVGSIQKQTANVSQCKRRVGSPKKELKRNARD